MFNNLGNLFKTKEQIEREEREKAIRIQRQKVRERARDIRNKAYEVQQIGNANAQLYQTQANVLRTQLPPRTNLLDYQRQTNNLVLNEQQEHNDFRLKRKLQDYQYINRNQHIDDVQEEYQKTKQTCFGNQPPPQMNQFNQTPPPPPQMNQFNQPPQTSTYSIPVINSHPQTPKINKHIQFADATTSPYLKDFGTSPYKSPPQTNKFANAATSPFKSPQNEEVSFANAKVYHVSSSSDDDNDNPPIKYGWIAFSDDESPQPYSIRKTFSSSSDSLPSDSSSDTFPNGSPKNKKQSDSKGKHSKKQTNSQPFPIHNDSLNTAGSDSTRRRRRRRPS